MRPNELACRRQIVLRLPKPRRNEIRTAEVIESRCLRSIERVVDWVQIDLGADDHDHLISPEGRLRIAMGRQ
jgi:hypothetical protein